MTAEPEQDNNFCVQLPPRLTGGIQLEKVTFQYLLMPHTVLQDIEVDIRPGQK